MNPEVRLGEVITALEAVGLKCLIMGGHAVRFYGVDRNTVDFDLHLALVEVVRRQYKVAAQAVDKADKQAIRAAQSRPR